MSSKVSDLSCNPTSAFEAIPGVTAIDGQLVGDDRGLFHKHFKSELFEPPFQIVEMFETISKLGVIRGMHFTAPPFAGRKIVRCVNGSVLDVLLDLRSGDTYGKVSCFFLNNPATSLCIPHGVAHGFMSLEPDTMMTYMSDVEYNKDYDRGIYFDSFGFSWPILPPDYKYIISDRDNEFEHFDDFKTPF